ncbi:MAG: hypothetical protein LQ346_005090 [Caloplaca aetnensis]|nr:MAG: hypothetical protein LQ346_005090 [Caloplaca aetnensis]
MLQALGSESESSLDAVLALLLILLPHLQAINFTFWFTPHGGAVFKYLPATLVDLLQNHSGTPSPGFLALEEIAYLTHPDVSVKADAFQPFSDVLYLFYMPNITSIQARAVEDTKTFRWPMSPPHRSTITSLSLKNSCMRAESLRKLLHATPNLRKLEYDYQCNFESPLTPVECPVLDCHKLRGVLDEVSASIESLILSVGFFADEDWDHQQNVDYGDVLLWGTSGSLGSMTEFLKLRYLKAPLVMLVGVLPPTTSLLEHQLPEGLREFCCSNELCKCYNFEWEDSDTWRQMLPLIRNRSGSLQKLHLDASSSDISFLWYPRTRAAIEKTCNEAGVAYNVIEYPWPYK